VVPPVAAKLVFGYATFTTPLGTEAVVILRGATIVKLYGWVAVNAVGLVLSVTLAVKLKVPVAVGVPLRAPAEVSVIPAGSAPELIVHA
jgi:hypothetical protein